MSDDELARTLVTVKALAARMRDHYAAHLADLPERDMAQVTGRQLTAVSRYVETWIAARACRATLQHS